MHKRQGLDKKRGDGARRKRIFKRQSERFFHPALDSKRKICYNKEHA